MSQPCTQLGHLVHLINTLASQEVQAVQILFVLREEQFLLGFLNRDDRLEDGALAILNPLSHGVQVGGEIDAGGEDALLVLAFRLTIELLPPFAHEVELRLVVHHDLNLLAVLVECIAYSGILSGGVLLKRNILATCFLHLLGTLNQGLDVETGTGDGQQAYGCEHRETAAHVVGDDEALVAFLVGTGTGSAFLCIGHGYDHLLCLLLATLGLALLLQQTEGESGLGGGSRFRDVDNTEPLVLQVFCKLVEVVLTDVVTGKENRRILLVLNEPAKRVAEAFDDGTGTEVAPADAGHHHSLAILAQHLGAGLNLVDELGGDG